MGVIDVAITAHQVFTETVLALPPSERLRLASLILQDLTKSEVTAVDRRDDWNQQDLSDLTTFSLQYAAQIYPEDEELV